MHLERIAAAAACCWNKVDQGDLYLSFRPQSTLRSFVLYSFVLCLHPFKYKMTLVVTEESIKTLTTVNRNPNKALERGQMCAEFGMKRI